MKSLRGSGGAVHRKHEKEDGEVGGASRGLGFRREGEVRLVESRACIAIKVCGLVSFGSSLVSFALLVEIYRMVPSSLPTSQRFSRYSSGATAWTPTTRARATSIRQ